MSFKQLQQLQQKMLQHFELTIFVAALHVWSDQHAGEGLQQTAEKGLFCCNCCSVLLQVKKQFFSALFLIATIATKKIYK
jgi:hypothetical protein